MNLLVIPQRMIDEGPCGFRFRLAASNLLSVRDLTMLEITGELEPIYGVGERNNLLDAGAFTPWVHRSSRFCPSCLASHQYWLIGWEVLFADACAKCGCWLVDTCSACNNPVSWSRPHLLKCICGKYFADELACAAPSSVVRLSQALQNVALGLNPIDMPMFHSLNLGQCVRLVRLLGTYGNDDGCNFPQKVNQVDTLHISWPITTMAAEIFDSWPAGLVKLLESLRLRGSIKDKGKLSTTFRGFYSALYKGFRDKEFNFLRAAFENYVAEHWTGAIGKRNRRLDETVLNAMSWIPANHACRVLDISRRRLNDLIEDGSLRGEKRLTAGHREFIVVKRSDVDKLALTLDDGVSLLEASFRLGLKKQRLLALLPIICPEAKKLGAQGCPWAIPVNWIERWETLIQTQVQTEPMDSRTVALGHLIRYWPWTTEQIGLLLVEMLKGEMVPTGVLTSGKGVGTLVFHVHDLHNWFSGMQRVPCAELTIPDTAIRLGVKQEVAYALVRSGLLQATSRKVGQRPEQRVSVKILEEFERRNILGRDVAQLLGRSPRAVAEFLLADGVRPISGPSVDNCRQNVFKRDAIYECLRRNGLNVPGITSLQQSPMGKSPAT